MIAKVILIYLIIGGTFSAVVNIILEEEYSLKTCILHWPLIITVAVYTVIKGSSGE